MMSPSRETNDPVQNPRLTTAPSGSASGSLSAGRLAPSDSRVLTCDGSASCLGSHIPPGFWKASRAASVASALTTGGGAAGVGVVVGTAGGLCELLQPN